MSNPSVVIKSLIAAVSNGICLAQTPAAAGALTLNGSLVSGGVATLDTQRRIIVTSTSGSDNTLIFTVSGTNDSGALISSTVTGVTTTPVATALDFKTVTSVVASAGSAGSITVGTNTVGSSVWVVDDFLCRVWALAVGVTVTGTVNYTVEHTYDDPNDSGATLAALPQQWSMEALSHVPPIAFPDSVLVNVTAQGETTFPNQPIFAHRLTINSGTGTAVMQSIQSGLGSGW